MWNENNFKPKDLFIRGLEVKKRGVSELLKIIGENKIMINLKDEHCNYFVTGNKFNSKFVKYYLSKCNLEKIQEFIKQKFN